MSAVSRLGSVEMAAEERPRIWQRRSSDVPELTRCSASASGSSAGTISSSNGSDAGAAHARLHRSCPQPAAARAGRVWPGRVVRPPAIRLALGRRAGAPAAHSRRIGGSGRSRWCWCVHSMLEYPLWYTFFLGFAAVVLGLGERRTVKLQSWPDGRGGTIVISRVAGAGLARDRPTVSRLSRAGELSGVPLPLHACDRGNQPARQGHADGGPPDLAARASTSSLAWRVRSASTPTI